MINRREFALSTAAAGAGLMMGVAAQRAAAHNSEKFKISLAQWSLNKPLFAGKLDNLDFAKKAKEAYDIRAIEYVNQFFKDKANDGAYLKDLKQRADDLGVKTLLIMVDGEGHLGDPDTAKRKAAVENHYQWVEAAEALGCHSIRVNAASAGSYYEQVGRAAEGLRGVSEFASDHGLNVIVENHGGLSSNGAWLAKVISTVGMVNCGTLPDFGNFRVGDGEMYDRYQGVAELMPYAKAVSAKSHDFDNEGNETETDYRRMMEIVLAAGYRGYVGIEYEGSKLSPDDGIMATKNLLMKVRDQLA